MSKASEWARRKLGLPEVNLAKTPLGSIIGQKVTTPIARQFVANLPDEELDALYTAAVTELLKRKRSEEQPKQ